MAAGHAVGNIFLLGFFFYRPTISILLFTNNKNIFFRCPQLCLKDFGCKCQDAANNTYVCLRTLPPAQQQQQTGKNNEENSLYCQFDDSEKFVEYYNLRDDPYQLDNRAYRRSCNCTTADPRRRKLLARYAKCRGSVNCF